MLTLVSPPRNADDARDGFSWFTIGSKACHAMHDSIQTIFFSGWGFQASAGDGLRAVSESMAVSQQPHVVLSPEGESCVLVGWSLGGQWAIQTAVAYPERVKGLVLVSSTPCFCEKESWHHGCNAAWWLDFQKKVQLAPQATLLRFIHLMLHGQKFEQGQRQQLLKKIQQHLILEKPDLLQGLQMLHQHDLREQLRALHMPVLFIHGENDRVIPCEASVWMAQEVPQARLHRIQNCGHALLWTHTQRLNEVMENWCQQIT